MVAWWPMSQQGGLFSGRANSPTGLLSGEGSPLARDGKEEASRCRPTPRHRTQDSGEGVGDEGPGQSPPARVLANWSSPAPRRAIKIYRDNSKPSQAPKNSVSVFVTSMAPRGTSETPDATSMARQPPGPAAWTLDVSRAALPAHHLDSPGSLGHPRACHTGAWAFSFCLKLMVAGHLSMVTNSRSDSSILEGPSLEGRRRESNEGDGGGGGGGPLTAPCAPGAGTLPTLQPQDTARLASSRHTLHPRTTRPGSCPCLAPKLLIRGWQKSWTVLCR